MQIARRKGIYRCPNDDQTIFRNEGQEIPTCSCGWDEWLFYVKDNSTWYPTLVIAIDNAISVAETSETLRVGSELNLKDGLVAKFDGLYRVVSKFSTKLPKQGTKDFPGIKIEKIGAINPDLPIHTVVSVAC